MADQRFKKRTRRRMVIVLVAEIPLVFGLALAESTGNFWLGAGYGFLLGYLFVLALLWCMAAEFKPEESDGGS